MVVEVNLDQQNNIEPPNPKIWIYVVLGIFIWLVIIGIIAFFILSSSEDSSSSTTNNNQNTISQDLESDNLIKCDDIPSDFDATDETYLDSNPEVRDSLLCISEAIGNCESASIKFLEDTSDYILTVEPDGNSCTINYQNDVQAIKCNYTKSQTKQMHEVAIENNQPYATGIGIVFALGIELLRFEPQKTVEETITNKESGEKEKIPCLFYDVGS